MHSNNLDISSSYICHCPDPPAPPSPLNISGESHFPQFYSRVPFSGYISFLTKLPGLALLGAASALYIFACQALPEPPLRASSHSA